MTGDRVLVSVVHATGTAGVLEEPDGSKWLTGFLEDGPGTGLTDVRGAIEGLADGQIVQGGLLPEGAAAVEVLLASGERAPAAVGDGAWVVVLQDELDEPAPVHFLGPDRQTIRSSLSAEWPREPVADAVEPCPVCASVGWEEVTPLDESRGMFGRDGDMHPTPIVVCTTCGFEIRSGGWVSVELPDEDIDDDVDPADHAHQEALWEEQSRADQRATLAAATVRVYVLAGWTGSMTLVGWGGSADRITDITITHGDETTAIWANVEHDSDTGGWRSDNADVRSRLAGLIQDRSSFPRERSRPAWSVWADHQDRTAARAVANAEIIEVSILVDDEPHDAVFLRYEDS